MACCLEVTCVLGLISAFCDMVKRSLGFNVLTICLPWGQWNWAKIFYGTSAPRSSFYSNRAGRKQLLWFLSNSSPE